jgi:NAD+ diphosphatase
MISQIEIESLFMEHVWFVFQEGKLLIANADTRDPLSAKDVETLQPLLIRQYALYSNHQYTVYCAEMPQHIEQPANLLSIPLKKALEQLGDLWYNLAVKAASIINWDKNHQFCGHCGHSTVHESNTFERRCTACNLLFYPRISPSVIVVIRHEDKILMARSPHFPPGAYGLIAGFVEPGESLENTVHREVFEEVGISIKNLSYFGSQSWPFPDSIMMAFTADYDAGDINIDGVEISEAGWYRFNQLPGRPTSKVSISSRLLDHTIDELAKRFL